MLSKTIYQLFFLTIALTAMTTLSSLLALNPVLAAELTVQVNKIQQHKGHLMVALYHGEPSYSSGKTELVARVEVKNNSESIVFPSLPDGDYAIKLYHDENDNQKLDFNMLGIPTENYGFSNNVGRFGAPKFEQARFAIKEHTAIEINLF